MCISQCLPWSLGVVSRCITPQSIQTYPNIIWRLFENTSAKVVAIILNDIFYKFYIVEYARIEREPIASKHAIRHFTSSLQQWSWLCRGDTADIKHVSGDTADIKHVSGDTSNIKHVSG